MKRYSQSFTRVVRLLLVVALLLTFTAPAFAEGGPGPKRTDTMSPISRQSSSGVIRKSISEFPSTEDAFWPVVRVEKSSSIDGSGVEHKHVTIIRERSLPTKQFVPCDSVNAESGLDTCYYVGQVSQLDVDSANGVASYQKHYADKYLCPSGNCIGGGTYLTNFYKMTRVENWWTRNDPTSGVSDADFLWGCTGSCFECGIGVTSAQTYNDAWSDIGWSNSTHSWTYIYTSSGWPVWAGSPDITFLVGAHMDSNGGSLSVQTAWRN